MTGAEQFRIARELSGLSIKELAEIIGVTAASVYNWEAGNCVPGKRTKQILCPLLKLTLADQVMTLRTDIGMTKAAMAEKTGYNKSSIYQIESPPHNTNPRIDFLRAISAVVGAPIEIGPFTEIAKPIKKLKIEVVPLQNIEKPIGPSIGNQLLRIRKERKLSTYEMAKICGFNRANYSHLELGDRELSIKRLISVATKLNRVFLIYP